MKLSALLVICASVFAATFSNLSPASAGNSRRSAPRSVSRQAGHPPIHCGSEQWVSGVFYCQNPTISFFGAEYRITGLSHGCGLIGMQDMSEEHVFVEHAGSETFASIENGVVSLESYYINYAQTMLVCVPCN